MKTYEVSKEETLIIGDSNYDIEAGKAAGIKVVAVTYGFRSMEFLRDADFIIDTFDKLLEIIPQI
jgi:phosphoglycolate phosphatase